MVEKEKIRPLYCELRGYLSQVPDATRTGGYYYGSELWEHYNSSIDELNEISDGNYGRFRVSPTRSGGGGKLYIDIGTYQTKLAGLVERLHGEFFSDEPSPSGGMPTTVISQSQEQTQSFQIQMLLEVQSKIDEKIPKFDEASKERKFLEKVKGSLASIRSIAGLIALLLSLAKEYGLSIEDLKSLFN